MTWEPYKLDKIAQDLVLKYRDTEDALNESHKMRSTVAYGLERFWGEHLRLLSKDKQKGEYWQDTWREFVELMRKADINVPKGEIPADKSTQAILETAEQFWNEEAFPREDRRIALAVLTQLCDSLVWWTQRYKRKDLTRNGSEKNNG